MPARSQLLLPPLCTLQLPSRVLLTNVAVLIGVTGALFGAAFAV